MYQRAIDALNNLQSDVKKLNPDQKPTNFFLERFRNNVEHLQRMGLTQYHLAALNPIHVAGTKGKGSVCAMVESVMRRRGLKTGFYSSPHLFEVRERIRLNGRPLSEDSFAKYFWETYDKLRVDELFATTDLPVPTYTCVVPNYFSFLTLMAFYVFHVEKVDVAVIEVGLGGLYDCTNIMKHPVVCGVTTIDYDHVAVLGDTLEKIALQKAGIFKTDVPAVSICAQEENVLNVFKEYASKVGAPFSVASELAANLSFPHDCSIVQRRNAGLAVELCRIWFDRFGSSKANINKMSNKLAPFDSLDDKVIVEGLSKYNWSGRFQRVDVVCRQKNTVHFFIDGAHTALSIGHCIDWFQSSVASVSTATGKPARRYLLFNITGERVVDVFCEKLVHCNFDYVLFSPNIMKPNVVDAQMVKVSASLDWQLKKSEEISLTWKRVADSAGKLTETKLFHCLSDCFDFIAETSASDETNPATSCVLITGSVHLAGCCLKLFNFDLDNSENSGSNCQDDTVLTLAWP